MQLRFLGGTGTVTGSKFLLQNDGQDVLVDCGLFQGLKALRRRNWRALPLDPSRLAAVLLTYAHIDHSGHLPRLVRQGFDGPVWVTEGTADLLRLLLPDAGHLQEEDARYAARRGFSRHRPPLPLYTEDDAIASLRQLRTVPWDVDQAIGDLRVRFRPAGHILGAAGIRVASPGGSVWFSGDLGRPNDPLMHAPKLPEEPVDVLVLESTYGLRSHPRTDPLEQLHAVVERTLARRGTVLIPSFAVGRTQTVLWALHTLIETGRLDPHVPIYVNSPMAIDATELLLRHHAEHRLSAAEARAMGARAIYVRTADESRALTRREGPAIVISASGMLSGGRVLHHLRQLAPEPRNTVLFCGYQATGTRGATLLEGADEVRVHGIDVPVHCEVARIDAWSAHADHREILAWLERWPAAPSQTFLVHGDPAALDALRGHLS
ncbi:MAG: MBL fold metallo-hydrolase, partial [Myxococcota bacterium]